LNAAKEIGEFLLGKAEQRKKLRDIFKSLPRNGRIKSKPAWRIFPQSCMISSQAKTPVSLSHR